MRTETRTDGHADVDWQSYRRLGIPQQAPIDLGEPFVLLDLARTSLAAQSKRIALVQESRHAVLAGAV